MHRCSAGSGSRGFGCTLTTLHCRREPEVKALLQIPEDWATAALVPVGWPLERGHGPVTRKPVERLASLDAFDAAWAPVR